jgi:hypothetical protein
MVAGLATDHGKEKTMMNDTTFTKANRTTSNLWFKKRAWPPDRLNQRQQKHQTARDLW